MSSIPKIIHYCWFGGNPKPDIVLKCIDTWKKYMPDYEIIEWNENNYDVHKSAFSSQAYEMKKWAFVSDYARFDILSQYGGIYFDTDVELLKPIPEEILSYDAFTAFESAGNINPGLVFASVKEFPIVGEIFEEYNRISFIKDGKVILKTVNAITTEIIEKHKLLKRNEFQVVSGMALYPCTYFCGYNQDLREYDIRPETISVHHYASTWKDESMKRKIQTLIKSVVGKKRYLLMLSLKRKLFGVYNK